MNIQMFKLDLEKAEEPEIKLPTSTGEFYKNIYVCFIDHAKTFASVSSSCLYCCVWGGLSVFWQFVEFSLLWSFLALGGVMSESVLPMFSSRNFSFWSYI